MPLELSLLIVEDNADALEVFGRRFERLGYRVTAIQHPREAIDLAVSEDFDVAIVDYFLPTMDGIQLMQRLKGLIAGLRVILLTGHHTPIAEEQAAKGGAYGYLVKPCPFDDLQQLVEQAVVDASEQDQQDEIHAHASSSVTGVS